jgi:hypothetical protein
VILFRSVPSEAPFLWETGDAQPAGRWHRRGDGPAQYLADTPDGAWAEFLRHEEISDPEDLAQVRRTMWAVEVPDDLALRTPRLERATLTGEIQSYALCQAEAARLRDAGALAIVAPSAALLDGEARGWRVADGIRPGPDRDGRVFVLFGARPELGAWRAAVEARPDPALLAKVRHFRRR